MCGVFGVIGDMGPERGRTLRDALKHRGPDSAGEWSDPKDGVWFGHRRLAVVDLSEAGTQPMLSPSSRYVIVFNGEVYNHTRLRIELERSGYFFRGHSDTEVMLAAIEAWGVKNAVKRFIGMFAFALWDREQRVLWLARDRLGVKPLYYASDEKGRIAFSSELRPLLGLPWVDDALDMAALAAYFRYLAVPAPDCIVRGVRKLEPGCLLRWDGRTASIERYWSLYEVARAGRATAFRGDLNEAADALEELLTDAVRLRLLADVPVGAFLSGGIDSSLVVALMQRVSAAPVRTFTIGFKERSHDESAYARAVAQHLGTRHEEAVLPISAVRDLVPRIGNVHDEPFADVSSLPTCLLSAVTRRHVTVALSGDGGDELFGGYPRYFWADRIAKWQDRLGGLAPLAAKALGMVPRKVWDGLVSFVTARQFDGSEGLSHRVTRFGGYLATRPAETYRQMISVWPEPRDLLGVEPASAGGPHPEVFSNLPWSEQMMATDQTAYLADDILTKVDRTSMAVSLEVRVPILDHRIVEFSWKLPINYKLAPSGDRGKLILRKLLYRYVPAELIERPKMGFGVPLGQWLRGPLREWAEDLLACVPRDGVLTSGAVQKAWEEHQSGRADERKIWAVLMYLQWRHSIVDCRTITKTCAIG